MAINDTTLAKYYLSPSLVSEKWVRQKVSPARVNETNRQGAVT